VLTLVFFFLSFLAQAQNLEQVKKDVKTLAAPEMHGRGYVNGGLEKASDFLLNRLESLGLEVSTQSYKFSVNTFPEKSKIRCGKRKFKEGEEFIINPGSPSYQGRGESILLDSADFQNSNLPALPSEGMIPVIKTDGIDTPEEVSAKYEWTKRATEVTPVVELKDKLTWSVGREVYANPVVEIRTDVYDTGCKRWKFSVSAEEIGFTAKNVIAKADGKRSDSLIVFTAHFDHLGRMGEALFPGASDNASGTAMVLDLAAHYVENRPEYDTYFIFFSGEEAGLIGSRYFVENPVFDLKKIKFLINLDLMGSAAKGITAVNGRLHEEEMKRMAKINTERNLIPKLKLRGKAANSDHYWFSERGVPAIFIYTEGNAKAYHDVYDTPENLDWANYEEVFTLLVEFVKTF
jgi:hypothetical protein